MDKDKIAALEAALKAGKYIGYISARSGGKTNANIIYEAARAHLEQLRKVSGYNEHLERLEMMADKEQRKWDLSDNDQAAIQWAIDTITPKGANNG